MTIERPKVPQLDAIFATVEKIHRAEKRLAALREQVAREARALSEIPDKRLRIEAGFYAYWFAPEVQATDIALGATGRPHPGKLLKLAGPVSLGIPCNRCGEDLPIHSRNQAKHPGLTCIPCQNELQEETLRRLHAECSVEERHRHDIAALPYPEYLRTEEWSDRREGYLWWRADQTGAIECETCEANTGLGLYHKSAAGIGTRDELTLLCTECRDALIAVGKLAGPPAEGNLIPPELAASVLEAQRAELSY